MKHNNEKGFVLVFVIAVVSALSIMTTAMFFYYDNDLKSVSRNSVMQQVTLSAETGLQEGQKWIADQLNSNRFSLVDIQNTLSVVDSDNKCLNRHGYTNANEDVYYAKKILANLGDDFEKFKNITYEVYIQRHADVTRSIYFSAEGSTGGQNKDTTYTDRSFALVEAFQDFPTEQFTIEMWIKNKQPTNTYDMHAFEWGRTWDLVFKVKNDEWSPRLGEVVLDDQEDVGTPVKDEWVHIAWVWDGGDPNVTDTGNVKIYQNGVLSGTFNANIGARNKSGFRNQPEILPTPPMPLAIGEGLSGFKPNNYETGAARIQSVPWLGNIAEMRIWNISRTGTDIANNNRRRLSGSEPGLVSYYKFNEGSGNIAKDFNTSRSADRRNDATVYGIGTTGTLWQTEITKYPVISTTDTAPSINVPPGEDVVYYKIISCGNGPQGQIIPLELIVTAPVQKGDVGDGNIVLTTEDLNSLTGQEGTTSVVSLNTFIAQEGVTGDIKVQENNTSNTDIFIFKRAMEQCNNAQTFTTFASTLAYAEEDCADYEGKLWMLEKDAGTSVGDSFDEADWVEVLGSGCDGVQFKSTSGDASYGHYYKYFSTAPNISSDLGYNGDSISWWEAKRRAEQSTCGGMRGYLVSIETAVENEFVKDAVTCESSAAAGCTGVIPFHVAAGETRANYYGSRLDAANDQHYVWLSNSDWRTPLTMRSESGPNMGQVLTFTSWQGGEPNGGTGGEDYTDMEINRSGRTVGGWNDLNRIPNCSSGGLDCITGYVVEYGGFDYFRLNHDDTDNEKDIAVTTKFCVVRATIEKDKFISGEDFLKYDTTAEDATASVSPDTSAVSDSDTTDDWPGWDEDNGVLTLNHTNKPLEWNPATNYANNAFTWFNNRVWKNTSGGSINGGAGLKISQTPTVYNPNVWSLYSGNESDAPCADVSVWQQAFESIKYFNDLEVAADDQANPFAYEDGGTLEDDATGTATLGERVILFSLGPLHIQKHLDGYNHFYEFYKFPVRASGTQNLYNDKNRRMGEGFVLSNQLHYFAKTGYLATVTSEAESNIITEKAVGNGWMGGLTQTANQSTAANLNTCGGVRQRSSRATASADSIALRTIENITLYKSGQTYPSGTYLRNIEEKNRSTPANKTITLISKANPAVITTSGNHGLIDDDIIKITDIDPSPSTQATLDGMTEMNTGFYRVVILSNTTFNLVHLDTRQNINSTSFSNYTASTAELHELDGIQNEFYRATEDITNSNIEPQSQDDLELFFKDPKLANFDVNPIISGDPVIPGDAVSNSDCPVWRWITGPEQFIWNNRGLAFSPSRSGADDPSANQNNSTGNWTRVAPAGQQVGEMFKDGMPFRKWNGSGPGEPNNVRSTEHGVHLLGIHFGASALTWNDLHNWNANHTHNYGIRGLIIEYGGLENDGDPITRITSKRVIKLQDRRVSKAIIKIKDGAETGDKLTVGANELTELGLTASGNETSTITISGDGSCKNYLDITKSIFFEHTGTTAGTREISVSIGDVVKPVGAEHYYQIVDGSLNYFQANFQASYANLCGVQGYLANVTTEADLTALGDLGVTDDKEAWVNGTDECQAGIYRAGFWRYTSGPWLDKEFWRLRINNPSVNETISACSLTALRSSENSVRVGPFAANNWVTSHPAANTNDYLTYIHASAAANRGIKTRAATADSDVESYIVRFGGSVGDFTGADIEEEDNNIDVLLGPIRAEISFYNDGSDNSVFIAGEDTVVVPTTGGGALTTGWNINQVFTTNSSPLKITPLTGQVATIADWRRELTKVYYKNINTSNFTPGNRKIKITLVYGDTSLNQTIGIVKTVGSRNKVTVTPISWNNR